jgi:hypothetical protein
MAYFSFETIEKWDDKIKYIKREDEALKLLVEESPKYSYEETRDLDFAGKDYWKYKNKWNKDYPNSKKKNIMKAYYCKVVAAKNFQRLAEKDKCRNSRIEKLEEAGFSYDKAAKNAEWTGMYTAAAICRIRACKIYSFLKNFSGKHEYYEDLEEAARHIRQIATGYENN